MPCFRSICIPGKARYICGVRTVYTELVPTDRWDGFGEVGTPSALRSRILMFTFADSCLFRHASDKCFVVLNNYSDFFLSLFTFKTSFHKPVYFFLYLGHLHSPLMQVLYFLALHHVPNHVFFYRLLKYRFIPYFISSLYQLPHNLLKILKGRIS